MELKHTKGEWEIKRTGMPILFDIFNSDNYFIGSVSSSDVKIEQATANANLIAASPIMLQALIEVQKHMNAFIPEHVFDKVNNAIEKATVNN